jgi:hypothetical protein
LKAILLRPGMFGSGQSFEITVRAQLADLAFIDEREGELAQAFEDLERNGLWGPLGAWGVLAGLFGPGNHTDDLAALYARVASKLGYFEPQRRVDSQCWADLQIARDWATRRTRSRVDVEARFGPPSYRSASQQPRTFGYTGPLLNAWIIFHFDGSPEGELKWIHVDDDASEREFVDVRPVSIDALIPEDVYRAFLVSTLSGSEPEVRKHTLLHPEPSVLWTEAYPADVARLLADQFRTMSVIRVNPSDSVVYLISEACPVPLAVINTDSGWKVDPDPLVRFRGETRT